MRERNKQNTDIRNSTSYQQFKKSLLSLIKSTCCQIFFIHKPDGVTWLVALRLRLIHLCEHKFRHNFHDTLNLLCPYRLKSEKTSHYLSRCHNFSSTSLAIMNDLDLMASSISEISEFELVNMLLYGDPKISISKNSQVFQSTIKYTVATKRFGESFISSCTCRLVFPFKRYFMTIYYIRYSNKIYYLHYI